MTNYMTFCRQAGGGGTTHITDVNARTPEEAARKGKEECLADWSWEDRPDDVWCVGVIRTKDCQVRLWDDENDLCALPLPKRAESSPITLNTRELKLDLFPWKRSEAGQAPEGAEVTKMNADSEYPYYKFKYPELFPPLVKRGMSSPVVIEMLGRRWRVQVETGDGDGGWPEHAMATFTPTDEPLTEPDAEWREAPEGYVNHQSHWGGQPTFIQGEVLPVGPDGKSAYPLCTIESGWGDAGNENVFVAFDEDGLPCGLYLEASCH